LIEFILKKYLTYRNKNDILSDNIYKQTDNLKRNNNTNTVENIKKRIDILRKSLLDEETNLLNLYKLRTS